MQRRRQRILMAAISAMGLSALSARAASLTWDANGVAPVNGGSGTWDTSSFNWVTSTGTYVNWKNAGQNGSTTDDAVLNGTAGVVTLGTSIAAGNLTFSTSGYTVDLNGSDLTLNTGLVSAVTATVANSSSTPSLLTFGTVGSAKFSGNLNVTKTGAGNWTPTIDSDFFGTAWLKNGGTVTFGAGGQLANTIGLIKLDGSTKLLFGTSSILSSTFARDIELEGTTQRIGPSGGVQAVTLAGKISGPGDFHIVEQQGELVLSGSNSYNGATLVDNVSSLVLANNNALGNTSSVSFIGAGLLGLQGNIAVDLGSKVVNLGSTNPVTGLGFIQNFSGDNTLTANIIGSTGPKTFGVEAGSSLTLPGSITFSRGLTKVGAGILVLSGPNTYGGGNVQTTDDATAVNAGTLRLDFSRVGAPSTDIINNGNAAITSNTASELILGGGTLEVVGKNGAVNSQRFKDRSGITATAFSLTINPGASAVKASTSGGGSMLVSLGHLWVRNIGGTVDFTLPSGTPSSTNGITMGSTGNFGNILGGYATVAGTDWAVAGGSGNPITVLPAVSYTNDTWGGATNTTVTTSNVSAFNNVTTNSLRFNAVGQNTVTLTGSNTISSGGILVTPNVSSNPTTITGGTIAPSNANYGGDLIINQNNTAGALKIDSVIAGTADPASRAGTISSTLVTGLSSTADLYPGMPVTGAVPAGTTILAISNSSQIVLSAAGTNGSSTLGFTSISGLTKSGAGELELTQSNTYIGPTNLNGGVLKLSAAGALGVGSLSLHGGVVGLTAASGNFTRTVGTGAGSVQFLGSGGFAAYGGTRAVNLGALVTWNNGGFVPTLSSLTLGATDADGMVDFQSNIRLYDINPSIPQNRTIYVERGSAPFSPSLPADAQISGILSDQAGITKTGSGALLLKATNTYSGATQVTAGTLTVARVLASKLITIDATSANANLVTNLSNSLPTSTSLTTNGNGAFTPSLYVDGGGSTAAVQTIANLTLAGTGAANTNVGVTQSIDSLSIGTFSNSVGGAGTSLTKLGAGTLNFTGAQTNGTGASLIINGGTVNFNSDGGSNLGVTLSSNTALNATVTQNLGAVNTAGTVNLTAAAGSFTSLAGSGNVLLSKSTGTTLTVGDSSSTVFSGVVGESVAGMGALVKIGTGQLTLTGSNTYAGLTTISAGTLMVGRGGSGAIANSAVSVSAGATLAGSGTTGDVNVATLGKINPSDTGAIATLSTGNLTLAGTYAPDILDTSVNGVTPSGDTSGSIVSGQNDIVSVTGTSEVLTGSTLDLSLITVQDSAIGHTYVLIQNSPGVTVTDTFATIVPPNGTLGYNVITNYDSDGSANDVAITFTAAPEPGSVGLFAMISFTALGRRKRRNVVKNRTALEPRA